VALALYRKYRPRTFAEVIGQEHVTEPLSQALRSGRLNHAYLFSGPRGCGKTSSARILARSLNCAQGPTPEPCGTCESCRSLATDGAGSIDVIEIDAASHGGVDDARELRERAFFAPATSRYKIYVIDEAHMVSTQGFNALLKLVEEPPEYVKFIFATTEPDKVLGTIRSRTHHYPFRLIPPRVLRPYLEQLCEAEGVKVEPTVFPLVVRAGGGSVRDSLSLLDQLIAAGDGAAAYATIDRVAEAGHDPRRFASDLLERLRDLIVLQQVPDAAAKGLLDVPADQLERMSAQAERFGPATLSRCADIVHTGLVDMRGTTAPRLLLELICARMLLPGAEDSTGALLQRLERMERRLTLTGGDASDQGVRAAPVPADSMVSRVPQSPPGPGSSPGAGPSPSSGQGSVSGAGPSSAAGPGGAGVSSGAAAAAIVPGQGAAASASTEHGESSVPAGRSPAGRGERPGAAVASTVDQGVTGGGPSAGPGDPPGARAAAALAQAAPPQQPVRPPVEAIMPDPVTPEPDRPGTVAPAALDAAAVRRVWDEILTVVSDRSKRTAALLREATVRDVIGETLVLTFRHSWHAESVSSAPGRLVEAVGEVLGGRWEVRCEFAGDQREAPGRQSSAPASRPPTGDIPAARSPRTAGGGRSPGDGGVGGGSGRAGAASGGPDGGGVAGAGAGADAGGDADWPEPARPGGNASAGSGSADDASAGDAPAGTASAFAGRGPRADAADTGAGTASAGVTAGRGSRAAGSGFAGNRPQAGAPSRGAGRPPTTRGRASSSSNGARDEEPLEEPPYDPEYDGPPGSAARTYAGFDPGDEPLDDAEEQATRQTSEQQALALLQQTLGAEKIGEIDAR
jgi:DNA polymerase III subunit gamma/tau